MLTLALLISLQQTPMPVEPTPAPATQTRESIKRGSSGGRFAAMTGIWFGAVFTTAAVGIVPGILVAGGGAWSGILGGIIGGLVGAGVGALISPLLMWGVARGLDGKGSLGVTWLGTLAGLAVCAALSLGAVYSFSDSGLATGLAIAAAVSSPLVIFGGPIAYSISHAINSGDESPVTLTPSVVPLKDGVLAGVAMTF